MFPWLVGKGKSLSFKYKLVFETKVQRECCKKRVCDNVHKTITNCNWLAVTGSPIFHLTFHNARYAWKLFSPLSPCDIKLSDKD